MKKIVYVTGSRAEYGLMKELLFKMHKSGKFDVSLIVTGMHLSHKYGWTLQQIKKDGLRIADEIDIHIEKSTNAGMAESIGYGIIGMTKALVKDKPDLVMVTGDRGELLAAAIAAAHLNIPVAHISGGDITTGANIDERIRHAITKFSSVHFAESDKSATNLIRWGENKKFVFAVGNPGVSSLPKFSFREKSALAKKYKLNLRQPILLAVQHPVTTQTDQAGVQMKETMEALKKLGMQTVLIYPNSDAGSRAMIAIIKKYRKLPFIRIFKSIPRHDFLGLMSLASAMIGNSSSALFEAPSFNLPAINLGLREEGRERAVNIIDADHSTPSIVTAVRRALKPEFRKKMISVKNPYAKPNTDKKIIKILLTRWKDIISGY